MKEHYDVILVGAGLFNAVLATRLIKYKKNVLVIEKRNHIGGNCYTENKDNIDIHKYGSHIFHTPNKTVWDFVNKFAEFNTFQLNTMANVDGTIYNLPFNMNTFAKVFNVATPEEAREAIEKDKMKEKMCIPSNLEEQAISMVGRTIFEKFIKGYTEKQWGMEANELPPFIIKRLPVRFTYDNNYFNDKYQGIPIGGYTQIIEKMLDGIDLKLNCDFFDERLKYEKIADKIIFTGPIDRYYNYCYGELEYRSVRFEHEVLNISNFQGNAVVNYTEKEIPYTRIIEHKHFEFGEQEKTIISREYSIKWDKNKEPYYPINNDRNNFLYAKYKELALKEKNVFFGGRLGAYKYYDMHQVIENALSFCEKEFAKE